MARNVELLTADASQEVLHPRTVTDMVVVSPTQNLTQKITEIETNFLDKRIGGVVSGHVTLDGSLRKFQIIAAGNTNDVLSVNGQDAATEVGSLNLRTTLVANEAPKWFDGTTKHEIWNNKNVPIEEGNFTPTLYGSTVAGNNIYEVQVGGYQRIGRYCHLSVQMRIVAGRGTMQGDIFIGGLPFPNRGTIATGSIAYARGFGVGANCQLGVYCEGGPTQNFVRIMYTDTSTSTGQRGYVNHTHLPTNSPIEIAMSILIRVAD